MTRLQLRRLALQATRRPELIPALQDALLESPYYGPKFEEMIAKAREENTPGLHTVIVFAASLEPHFSIRKFYDSDFDWSWRYSLARRHARLGEVPVLVVSRRWRGE